MNPLQQTIEALAKEKGIEPDVVISAIEEAVATASRKYYKTGENLKTRFNTGDRPGRSVRAQDRRRRTSPTRPPRSRIDEARQMYRSSTATKSPTASSSATRWSFPKPTEVLGRIAAQTAKQVIFQKVREAERENIFAEYNQRDRRGA